ncbi:MAG: AAA family ATPase, partial [Phycisphaerales bacterium]
MLNCLNLENFRSFGSLTRVPLAPITLLFGENSAGKSSILAALQFLKQSHAVRDTGQPFRLRGANSIVDLGSYEDVVFEHRSGRPITIG